MQTYAIRMFNFMRFGEKGNSVVFDLTSQEKKDLKDGAITMDQIYDRVLEDPVKHIKEVKRRGAERLLAIAGIVDGNQDFSNGAGKSTIMEAMCYTRYERIVRRTAQNPGKIEKAGVSVVTKIDGKYPPDMKKSWVEEICEIAGKIYRIRRGRSFRKGHKSHSPIMELECLSEGSTDSMMSHRSPDTKKNLNEILTMDYDLFVNSQMFGQNDAGKYLIGTDKTKKEMLIALLKLENVVNGCLENIRKRKSAQEKKVNNIRTTLNVMETSLCSKYEELLSKTVEQLDEATIKEINEEFSVLIDSSNKNIKGLEKRIRLLDVQMGDLAKSEKLQKVESIREEGRRVSKEKKSKEQAMAEQVSEWEKLSEECKENLANKNKQIISIFEKGEKLQASKVKSETFVSKFDLPRYEKQLKRIAKAKELKPQISKSLVEARENHQKHSNDVAVLFNLVKLLNADLEKLNGHGGNGFVCPECKTLVTRENILSSIESTKETIEKQTGHLNTAKENDSLWQKKIEEFESKSTQINDMLVTEARVNAGIKEFEDTKVKVTEFEEQVKENAASLKLVGEEKITLEKKINTYNIKVSEIKKQFESELNGFREKIKSLIQDLKQAEDDAKVVNEQLLALKDEKSGFELEKNKAIEKHGSTLKDKTHTTTQISGWEEKRKEYALEKKQQSRILLLEEVYGLGGIQTRIVKKYLPLLNVHIKEFLDILSDGTMSVKMLINDKGKVDMVISGGTAETYEMLSGGEKTIVRLAVDIGLSLLAFSRTTLKPEMICLDEIFGSLDAGRTKNVFKVLNRLSDKFSRILLISHDANINNQIRSKIIVEKSGGRMGLSEIKRIE